MRSVSSSRAWGATVRPDCSRCATAVPSPSVRTRRPARSMGCRRPRRRSTQSTASCRSRPSDQRSATSCARPCSCRDDAPDEDRQMKTGKVVLSDEEFAQLRSLLARAAGLVFDEARRDSVAYCIAGRLRATGARDVSSYLSLLSDSSERQQLLNEVTIQETHFFRNPPQIRALRKYVIPELLKHADTRDRRIRIWSAGCSTGEEPYTVAMLLRELLPTTAGWDVKVVATDVSSRALESARRARYGKRAVQMASPDDLARFFVASGSGHYEVRPEVRNLVEFRHQNLVTDPVP